MIVLFSGPAAGGKSSICRELEQEMNFLPIKSSSYLKRIAVSKSIPITREALQAIGDDLDTKTEYAWIIDEVAIPQLGEKKDHCNWYVDSVRKPKQVELFRSKFQELILHVHVSAPENVLRERFEFRRNQNLDRSYEKNYDEHIEHPNEISARSLGDISDYVIDSSSMSPEEACRIIRQWTM